MRCAACDEKCYNRTAKYYTVLQNSNLYNHALQQYWKELEALPRCGKQTGDQFCAQARHEVSVWGCLLVEHSDSSTVDTPLLIQTYDRCERDFGTTRHFAPINCCGWLSSRFLAVGIGLQKLIWSRCIPFGRR